MGWGDRVCVIQRIWENKRQKNMEIEKVWKKKERKVSGLGVCVRLHWFHFGDQIYYLEINQEK